MPGDFMIKAILNLSFYNILGKLVLQREFNNSMNEIDISPLAKGIYIIELSCTNWTVHKKFVKE